MGTFEFFKYVVIAQFFWSFFITMMVSTLPVNYVTTQELFGGVNRDLNEMSLDIEGGLSQQKDTPIADFGALVFYSGVFIVDLMANFFFAFPQMVGLFVAGIFFLVPVYGVLQVQVIALVQVLTGAIYMLSFISLLLNMRSSGGAIR
jgi:hypothetical protein